MKKIYIVLTHTGTILSTIIKTYTKDEFSHVSIALDDELRQMYSFGSLNPYNPFWGGFVHEYIDKGTFKRFPRTVATIYSLDITDRQYYKIKSSIEIFEKYKKKYNFNVFGMFAAGFHKKIGKEYSFYCAEFVRYLLKKGKIRTGLPEIIRPEDFKNIKGLSLVYNGLLKKYKAEINIDKELEHVI